MALGSLLGAAWGVAAVAIASVAVAVRAAFLGERQLFRDEAASWLVAGLPVGDLVARVAREPYPPLYHLLLHAWLSVVPATEATLRLPSLVAALAVVAIGWRWAHEALGRWPGLVAAAVLALSPLAIANARDARMYALESAFAVVAWWLTWRLVSGRAGSRPAAHAILLAVAVAGELWTLALGLGVAGLQGLVALGAAVLASRRRAPPAVTRAAWAAVAALIAGGMLFLPWLPQMLGMAAGGREFWTEPVEGLDWLWTFQQMLGGWRGDLPHDPRAQRALLIVAELGIVAAVLDPRGARRALGWCLLAGIALVPLVWAVSLARSIYDTRYLAAALPALALAIAAGGDALGRAVAALPRQWRAVPPRLSHAARAAVVLLVGAFAVWVTALGATGWLSDWRRESGLPPTRQLVDVVLERTRPGDVLLAVDARSYFPLAWELERRGAAIPAYDWEPPDEPFFRGQALLDPRVRVTPQEARKGWQAALPGLAASGRIWLIALANDRDEDLEFAPLDSGELREIDRIAVEPVDEAGQARLLVPASR